MKKLRNLSENTFLKLFFGCFSLSFLVAAVCMPDRGQMFTGLWQIWSHTTNANTDFFTVGGYAATFLNMGLVGMICTGLYCIPGEKEHHVATLATVLTTGFGAWGIHPMNMWPGMLGVAVYCLLKKERLGCHTNAMLFSTGIAPFLSELMLRYPNANIVGFTPVGVVLAAALGIVVGMSLPAGLDFSPRVHRGFVRYSAALPVGMTAFLLQSFLYRAMGVALPPAAETFAQGSGGIVNTFCLALFSLCVIGALLLGCTPRDYWRLMKNETDAINYAATYGNAAMLMNVGLYGFFILSYYNWIGAQLNGVTFGVIFCMLATCNAGSNPANIWAITLGYGLASKLFQLLAPLTGGEFIQYLHAQPIVIGLCYANGLSPIVDRYGWQYGMVAAMMHFCMVTTLPELHGGLCLYNGGFTAAMVCLLMVPALERHFRTKEDRRIRKAEKNTQKTK